MDYLNHLKELSFTFAEELRQHSVLNKYWNSVSLIVKGSSARGFADEYSDVDFVLFTDTETYGKMVADYVSQGLSQRTDGVFLPLGNWEGHYNLDTYEHLQQYFDDNDVMYIWEYVNVRIIHDPQGIYGKIIEDKTKAFQNRLDSLIKEQYLNIQLQLDWMRQPLRRGDKGAALLYGAAFWQACCRLLYLLNGRPYPCDKWLLYYLDDLPLYKTEAGGAKEYYESFSALGDLSAGKDLMEYPMYAMGADLTSALAGALHEKYGDRQWIDEWYLYA